MQTDKTIHSTDSHWQKALATIRTRPLRFRPDFPDVARRWETWWRFEATRPLLILAAPKRLDIRWGKAYDLLDQPAEWLAVRRRQIENTHYVGEALPWIRVDIGPVALAAFLGAPLHLAEAENTTWQEPIITDWKQCPPLATNWSNPWLQKVLALSRLTAQDAAGAYLVCLPDLSGAIDALSNLRTPEQLCLDLIEHREEALTAADQVTRSWHEIFQALQAAILGEGAGVTQWLGCWSDTPHTVPTCDFNALIGEQDFREVCLPSLREQARLAGRCVFHLDGPQAARHAAALAQEPAITAVQYTPGAGTPSALAKLDLLRMLQSAGKPILVFCPLEEVDELADRLDPRGLAICPCDIPTEQHTPQAVDEIVGRVQARF